MQHPPRIDDIPDPSRPTRRVDRAFHNAVVISRSALVAIELRASADSTLLMPARQARTVPLLAPKPRVTDAPVAGLLAPNPPGTEAPVDGLSTPDRAADLPALDRAADLPAADQAAPCPVARHDVDAQGRWRRTSEPLAVLSALDHLSEAEELLGLLGSLAGVDRRSVVRHGDSITAEILRLAGATRWRLDRLEVGYGRADWALRLQIRRVLVGSAHHRQPSVMALLSRAAAELATPEAAVEEGRARLRSYRGGRAAPAALVRALVSRRLSDRRGHPVH
jgi:hypothetical protein